MSGSVINPSLESNLDLVAKVFHRHILHSGGSLTDDNAELLTKFDIDNFVSKRYRVSMPSLSMQYAGVFFFQKRNLLKVSVPTVKDIRGFLGLIFSKVRLNVQCAIVCLIYCERLMRSKNIAITKRNWRPILIVCLLESSKMWDDLSSWNFEFSQLFPCFGTEEMNYLEKMFLHEISYDLFVSGSMYARYYYSLRGLRYTSEKDIPNNYLDIQLKKKSSYQHQISVKYPSGAKSCLATSLDSKKEMLDNKESCPIDCLDTPSPLIMTGKFDDVKLEELGSDRMRDREAQFNVIDGRGK